VYSAYEHLLAGGTYPFFVLFLETDPRQVDVNIHPSKMEAKFEDEQGIYRMVSSVARKALAGGTSVPSLTGTGHSDDLGLAFTTRQHSWPRNIPWWTSAPARSCRSSALRERSPGDLSRSPR
jgi:DNA mismatch repair ATPase MutL